MGTPNMHLTHPPLLTDSFSLLIKSMMLLSRVKNFNLRFRRDRDEEVPDPRTTPEFGVLDDLLDAYLPSFPSSFQDPVGVKTGAKVDPVLYLGHLIPHL